MTGFLVFTCVIIWLAVGGWACRRLLLAEPGLGEYALGLLAFCLILAPFAAGMALCEALNDGDAP